LDDTPQRKLNAHARKNNIDEPLKI